jgi:anti-anti-sigma factor
MMVANSLKYLQCSTVDGVLVLTLLPAEMQGDELADALRQELLAAVAQVGAKKVVLDFQNVKYLGSAGFRPLLSIHRYLRESGGQMLLCNLGEQVEEVFRVTHLINPNKSSSPFEQATDVAAAVVQLNRSTEAST